MISGDTIVSEANVAYVANRYVKPKVLKYIESTGTQYIDTGYIPNRKQVFGAVWVRAWRTMHVTAR